MDNKNIIIRSTVLKRRVCTNTFEIQSQIGMMNVNLVIPELNLHVLGVITAGVVIGRRK